MTFQIETVRADPDTNATLVTLRDGQEPEMGSRLRDEAGAIWHVTGFTLSEIRMVPSVSGGLSFPKGKKMVIVPNTHITKPQPMQNPIAS